MHKQSQQMRFLAELLEKIENNDSFRKFLKKHTQRLNFDQKNILNLSMQKLLSLYKNLQIKINALINSQKPMLLPQNGTWLQNQLRIFIYILFTYLFLTKKSLNQLSIQDYEFFHYLFQTKSIQHIEYQIRLLISLKNSKWIVQQSRLFQIIMRENHQSKRWNHIAKQMFIRSNKKYFKTPKQCRQRWLNHADPKKLKGNWAFKQDIILLNSVNNIGKKWTLISKQLNQTRSQNSVKNRYNSLMKSAKKNYGYQLPQEILIDNLLINLYKMEQKEEKRKQQQIQQQILKNTQQSIQQQQDQKIKFELGLFPKIATQTSKHQQQINIEIENNNNTTNPKENQLQQNKQSIISQTITNHNMINPIILPQSQCETDLIKSFNYEMKNIFDYQYDIQNLIWNSSQNYQKLQLDQNYFINQGRFEFMENQTI